MIGYGKAGLITLALWLGYLSFSSVAKADHENDFEKTFGHAGNAFVEGNFTLGTRILNELISDHPGNFDLASRALHRICLSEYMELVSNDWPSSGYPAKFLQAAGNDHTKMWALVSSYVREAFLVEGKFAKDKERYIAFPPLYFLESLWRSRGDYPLTPIENMSDNAAERILALRRSGHLDPNAPAVLDASTLLVFLRSKQKRHLEAAQLVDELVTANNDQIDWLLARAKFHSIIRSPRAHNLLRDLFAKLDDSGVDPIIAKAARRAEPLRNSWIGTPNEPFLKEQGWMKQMAPDEDNQLWDRLAAGLANGLEEQIDLWIQGSLSEDQSQVYMLRKDGSGSATTWSVLDYQLKSLDPKKIMGLRKFQESRCRLDRRFMNRDKATQADKLGLFRRFPWAETSHRQLMAYAQRELMNGRGQSARRAFRDLLEHTDLPAIKSSARVGIWLAAAQEKNIGELVSLFDEVDESEIFPWMDKTASAKDIRARLMKGIKPTPANAPPTLADLNVRFLKLPARPLWPQHRSSPGLEFVELQSVGSNLLVSTRNVLALYNATNGNRPVWVDAFRGVHGSSTNRIGRFRPIIRESMIYTRWGYEADARRLVAMDTATRNIIWNLDVTGPEDARRKIPLGNPVLSGGQIYLAAAWDGHRSTGGFNLRLTSVDAATGRKNWHKDLHIQSGQPKFVGMFGESLTVHDGAIYCSPSTGFLGRFDPRDGQMEWMYNYKSVPEHSLHANSLGTPPQVIGDIVIGLPRDTNTMTGLDKETGETLWSSSLLLPKEIIGIVGTNALVHCLTSLVAVNSLTGEIIWKVNFSNRIIGQPTMQGSSIYLSDEENLYLFDATTGIELERLELPETKNSIRNIIVLNKNIYLITDEPSVENESSFVRKTPDDAAWEISLKDPKLYVPKANETQQEEILIYEDGMLHCLDGTAAGKVLWQRFAYPPQDMFFVEGMIVLLYNKGRSDLYLKALDSKTGDLKWNLTLLRLRSGHGSTFGRFGKYFYGRDNTDRFTLVDLSLGEVILENRISRRNGNVKAGFGGGQVQFLLTPAYRTTLQWLSWDLGKNEILGSKQELKGRDGEPEKPFSNNFLEFAKFGSQSCYFISRQEGQGREYVAYRGDYKDRSVQVVGKNTRHLKFEPPYLLMQKEETEQNKKDRTHAWVVQREDDPGFSYSIDLPHEWYHRPTFINGRLLEVRPPRNKQPYTVRVHDLASKKTLFTHTSENTERMGGVAVGLNRILVYDWKRNNRGTAPHFKLTPYDLNSGLADPTIEIDYWNSNNQPPSEIRVIGNLILINHRTSIKAWDIRNFSNVPIEK
jgi:outer membrane protein assembly factor BamB